MDQFLDRKEELKELNDLLKSPKGQMLALYGRRRVGKTTLLTHWMQQAGRPYVYWVARRETAEASRQSLARALWNWAYPQSRGVEPPIFSSWETLFEQMARLIGEQPLILVWDEFPQAVESDPSLPSHLQAAWDHLLKDRPIILILAGSHIGMMVDLVEYDAPLYGRFAGQMPVDPLPFATLSQFFPGWKADERVAAYATLGGIPAYLERFDPQMDLSANIRQHLFRRTGMFRSEPTLLISELVRETRIYETVLRAVATSQHTFSDIVKATGLTSSNLPPYLKRLQDLRLIERRTPATLPPEQRTASPRGRYHLRDPYLRFYFRFIEPNLEIIELGNVNTLWDRIAEDFRAFIGMTAFEELCRIWVLAKSYTPGFPVLPEIIGSHWSADEQVDIVAVNWRKKTILLGECKWWVEPVNRSVITDLIQKAPNIVPGPDWKIVYAFFARTGFTPAAQEEAQALNAILVDLQRLDIDLQELS